MREVPPGEQRPFLGTAPPISIGWLLDAARELTLILRARSAQQSAPLICD